MKLLLLALVALASAEPDSDSLWYNRLGYSGYNNYPTTAYSGFNGFYPSTAGYTAGYHPYSNVYSHQLGKREVEEDGHHLGKREADSEPNHHLVYNQQPFVYNQHVYKTPLTTVGEPVFKSGTFHTNLRNVAQGVHTPYAHTVGQVYQPVYKHFVKREADSEPEPYYPTVGYPFANTYGLNYQYPSAYNYNNFYSGYTGVPRTVYNHGLYKREAESDSESYYPYNTYNTAAYSTYRTPYVNNFAYGAAYNPYTRYSGLYY